MIKILNKNERIDDLQINNLKIIQNTDGFCFGIDSILLSEFAKDLKNNSSVIDLGTGTGVLGFLLLAKYKINSIVGIEVQEEVAEMAKRSIILNNLEDKFNVINCDVKEVLSHIKKESFDIVITNPPYKKINTGAMNSNEKKQISRHEVIADIFDFVKAAKNVLKDKGTLYMVHRPERIADIICALRKNKIEPKKIRFVYSNYGSQEAKLVLIKAIKNGGEFVKIEKPLYIYNENGEYTDEVKKIYE